MAAYGELSTATVSRAAIRGADFANESCIGQATVIRTQRGQP